jgi:hypothetical protein
VVEITLVQHLLLELQTKVLLVEVVVVGVHQAQVELLLFQLAELPLVRQAVKPLILMVIQ